MLATYVKLQFASVGALGLLLLLVQTKLLIHTGAPVRLARYAPTRVTPGKPAARQACERVAVGSDDGKHTTPHALCRDGRSCRTPRDVPADGEDAGARRYSHDAAANAGANSHETVTATLLFPAVFSTRSQYASVALAAEQLETVRTTGIASLTVAITVMDATKGVAVLGATAPIDRQIASAVTTDVLVKRTAPQDAVAFGRACGDPDRLLGSPVAASISRNSHEPASQSNLMSSLCALQSYELYVMAQLGNASDPDAQERSSIQMGPFSADCMPATSMVELMAGRSVWFTLYPSARHSTCASLMPNPSSQTVPHSVEDEGRTCTSPAETMPGS